MSNNHEQGEVTPKITEVFTNISPNSPTEVKSKAQKDDIIEVSGTVQEKEDGSKDIIEVFEIEKEKDDPSAFIKKSCI